MYLSPFFQEVLSWTEKTLNQLYPSARVNTENLPSLLAIPPQFSLGQCALPCFAFAKTLKLAPGPIAQSLAREFKMGQSPFIFKVDAVGGYLNFHIHHGNNLMQMERSLTNNSFVTPVKNPLTVHLEYSQPNSHKALHIGHLRGLFIGDAMARIMSAVGHTPIRTTYVGDAGTHIKKILWYLLHGNPDGPHWTEIKEEDRDNWLGENYAKACKALENKDPTAAQRKQFEDIQKQLWEKKDPAYSLWKETRKWSFDAMEQLYAWCQTPFDHWYSESELEEASVTLVKQKLKEGVFVKSQGAIGMDLSDHGLGFAMYLKSNGEALYLTKDLLLIEEKFRMPNVAYSVVVVDGRQTFHFKQLFKTAELLGYKQAQKSHHLIYETVNNGKGEAFSSRVKNGLTIDALRKSLEQTITEQHLSRRDFSAEQKNRIASDVALGALKYGMLRVDTVTPVNFIQEEWLKLDGDTGPYLQYVHTRCKSLLEKNGFLDENKNPSQRKIPSHEEQHWELGSTEGELLFQLSQYPAVLHHAAHSYKPHLVATHLYSICRLFNRFYQECPVQKAPEPIQQMRLRIVYLCQRVLAQGMVVLGMPIPEAM